MECSICNKEIKGRVVTAADGSQHVPYERGNSAHPINNGRCCDECNHSVVVPARLFNIMQSRSKEV